MCGRLISIKVVTVRKDHHCYACECFNDAGYGEHEFTPEEWTVIQKARSDGFKVLKGTQCERSIVANDESIDTFYERPEMTKICDKYELWREC